MDEHSFFLLITQTLMTILTDPNGYSSKRLIFVIGQLNLLLTRMQNYFAELNANLTPLK